MTRVAAKITKSNRHDSGTKCVADFVELFSQKVPAGRTGHGNKINFKNEIFFKFLNKSLIFGNYCFSVYYKNV